MGCNFRVAEITRSLGVAPLASSDVVAQTSKLITSNRRHNFKSSPYAWGKFCVVRGAEYDLGRARTGILPTAKGLDPE